MSEPKITYPRKKHFTTRELAKNEKEEWVFKITKRTDGLDTLLSTWVEIAKDITYEPLSLHGLVKECEFDILFQREITDIQSLQNRKGFFIQHVKAKIPDLKMFSNCYLSVSEHRLYIHDLPQQVQEITFSFEENSLYVDFLEKIGKPIRLTPQEAIAKLKEPNCFGLFMEDIHKEGSFTTRNVFDRKLSTRSVQ